MSQFLAEFVRLRDLFNDNIIFSVGVLLIVGYLFGKLVEKIKLPSISGYIIAGMLLSESFTGIIHLEMVGSLRTITEVALSFIALTIGMEFSIGKLKRVGRGVVIITLFQLILTFLLVTMGIWFFQWPLIFAMLLGAIAAATAPAATVVIIQQLRVRGPFVDHLYGIVALDDAGCVLLFSVVLAMASTMLRGTGETVSAWLPIGHAVLEIGCSLLLGLVAGVIIHLTTKRKHNINEILIISLGIIFLIAAIAITTNLSPLLTNMMLGATLINLSRKNQRLARIIEPLTPPLYAAFFAIAGTEFNIGILTDRAVLLIGLAYIILRMIGKYTGVYLGAVAAGSPRGIRNYLGLCMFPQAGVAIGLVLFVQASSFMVNADPATRIMVTQMVNIVLFSVFVNELLGPVLSRWGIVKGMEL